MLSVVSYSIAPRLFKDWCLIELQNYTCDFMYTYIRNLSQHFLYSAYIKSKMHLHLQVLNEVIFETTFFGSQLYPPDLIYLNCFDNNDLPQEQSQASAHMSNVYTTRTLSHCSFLITGLNYAKNNEVDKLTHYGGTRSCFFIISSRQVQTIFTRK
jgi:hypothetical protein